MKKLIIIILFIGIFGGSVEAKKIKNPLMACDTVVWAGLDYSLMRMTGSDSLGDPDGFNSPHIIFMLCSSTLLQGK
jgi:hypothetical protein